ncbi:hypothetical protein GmHk_08G023580 [Glycine max]|nr:hypothetical protein GmHk_08G023580 [Glycine max]
MDQAQNERKNYSLTSTQGVTDKLKQIKQEKEEKKEEKKKREGNDEMKGIKGYPKKLVQTKLGFDRCPSLLFFY